MTSYLVATSSVHVTAAAADYLADCLEPEDDVAVVGVEPPNEPSRDVADAANVARSRLAAAAPTVDLREGEPVGEIHAAIDEYDPDVVVIGPNAGTEDASGLGATAAALLGEADRPVAVVPTDLGPD